MDENKEILFMRQSKLKNWMYIYSNKNKLLGDNVKALVISRKYLVEVMKSKRKWCTVSAIIETED